MIQYFNDMYHDTLLTGLHGNIDDFVCLKLYLVIFDLLFMNRNHLFWYTTDVALACLAFIPDTQQ